MKRRISTILFWLFFIIISTSNYVYQEKNSISNISTQNINSFEGMWLRELDSMVLYIVDYNVDSFAFVMVSYLGGHYGFLGRSDGGFYKYARINNDSAYFNDTGAYSDGRPLYYEGEEPCELTFSIVDPETIKVTEQYTCGVYGGHSAYWRGIYKQYSNSKILHDLKEASKRE